jgi:hypothetical protein
LLFHTSLGLHNLGFIGFAQYPTLKSFRILSSMRVKSNSDISFQSECFFSQAALHVWKTIVANTPKTLKRYYASFDKYFNCTPCIRIIWKAAGMHLYIAVSSYVHSHLLEIICPYCWSSYGLLDDHLVSLSESLVNACLVVIYNYTFVKIVYFLYLRKNTYPIWSWKNWKVSFFRIIFWDTLVSSAATLIDIYMKFLKIDLTFCYFWSMVLS